MLFNTQSALAVTGVLMAATSVEAEDFKVFPRGIEATLIGCYSSIPGFGKSSTYTYQSSGWCLDHCSKEFATFALTGGSDCVCGDTLPPSSDKVSSDKCNKPCSGWPSDMCGASNYYSLYTTGLLDDVPTYEKEDTKSKSTTTTSKAQQTSTTKTESVATTISTAPSGETQVVTTHPSATPTPTDDIEEQTSKSHNTAAIAAGVVVGVVGFAALCGAIFFWWRSKRNKTNPGSAPVGGYGRDSGPPSMSDSRFDGDFMAQRRQSNGSIDDDHDFSRRILQVANPDR
ncbi:Carbohydrate-binding WSC subgroup [Penicillium paradoxum]|uniref:Carbohydrate-binding WSC subgroup n=1 Tax=Penicillium paradoxum TaxID=176176 RepID=UPI002547D4FB|nr:Carbohydrate-binding WSC subgroup [Penicillium paradoxum]KAJ5779603.1 Carbohydrate-binding WSC subgroup [Penicillium paradoxum]